MPEFRWVPAQTMLLLRALDPKMYQRCTSALGNFYAALQAKTFAACLKTHGSFGAGNLLATKSPVRALIVAKEVLTVPLPNLKM